MDFDITLAGPSVAVALAYSDNLPRGPSATTGGGWQTATPLRRKAALPYQPTTKTIVTVNAPWVTATPLKRRAVLVWPASTLLTRTLRTPWATATPLPARAAGVMQWDETSRVERQPLVIPWQEATSRGGRRYHALWEQSTPLERQPLVVPWGTARPLSPPDLHVVTGQKQSIAVRLRVPWNTARHAPPGRNGVPPLLPPDPPQPPVDTVIVPIQRVYMVTNYVSLVRLDTGAVLIAPSMQLSLDVDSWTWGFSATIPASQLSLVLPDSDGTPVILAATINGAVYHLLAEGLSRDRSFNSATVRINGRGRNALLDAPYSRTQTFSNAADETALQLFDSALTENGTSIGWEVDTTGLTDWLVPAGAWNFSGSYIGAVQSVAASAGAYLQPHPTANILRVLPRYPVAPWNWNTLTPDFQLPADIASVEGITWTEKPRYNRVFVSGTGQGVLGQVTRDGTAGDVVAQMVTDALMTAPAAVRQRGLPVLADTGRQAFVSLRTPVLPATGLILPGKFIRYVDGTVTRVGIVRSTAVDVGFPDVWQTIGVETHE